MTNSKSWREVLPIHPAAELFPLMSPDELAALGEDIRKHGLTSSIVLWSDGKSQALLLDGRSRLDAIEREIGPAIVGAPSITAGKDFLAINKVIVLDRSVDPYAYVISANIHRRHLTAEQKRELIAKLIKATPEKSDRQIAETVKASPTTVGTVRAEMEAKGDVSKLDTRTDSLGRQQLAHRTICPPNKVIESLDPESASFETITLKTYLGEDVRYPLPKGKATFIRQTNEQISWAGWSWNPVTGCLHNCRYCYAREGAEMNPYLRKFYPAGFTPLFHRERLDAPANTKVPAEALHDPRLGRTFVVSMGDMFGRWVPDEWIEQVFARCIENPQWEYLFLTKFPQRYVGLQLPPTAWIGTTVDEQYRVKIAEEAFSKISGVRVKWLSLEPLLAPLEFTDLSMFDWVVIGAQSATEQPPPIGHVPEFAPTFESVMRIVAQAREAGCRIYMKPNLLGDYHPQSPGMKLIQEQPACFDPPPADDGLDIPASPRPAVP
jgi:protein gp37